MMTRQKIDYGTLVKRDRIHASVYSDSEIFAAELEKIFSRGWVYVGHTGEIPAPGDFRSKRIGRQPVIMVRDDRGEIRRGKQDVFIGRTIHKLRREGAGLRIASKKVLPINNDVFIDNLTFLV